MQPERILKKDYMEITLSVQNAVFLHKTVMTIDLLNYH